MGVFNLTWAWVWLTKIEPQSLRGRVCSPRWLRMVQHVYKVGLHVFLIRQCDVLWINNDLFHRRVLGSYLKHLFCYCFGFWSNELFDKSLILGWLWLLAFILNNTWILDIWCSTIPHLPGCFSPWTFFENIRFNTVLTHPFMSHLATQLGYSAGQFQALQLIVLAAFGIVDWPLASCMLVHLLEIEF